MRTCKSHPMSTLSRAIFLVLTLAILPLTSSCERPTNASVASFGWEQMPDILDDIQAPTFPAKDFSILDYGAVGDGDTDCTTAIREAIAACNAAGGGRVVVPAGTFLTGAIHLKGNVNLHLSKGATLLFSQDPADYLPVVFTRFEGVECMNYSPFIYAYEQKNIAITGSGTLDGQATEDTWWAWKREREDVASLYNMGESNIPVSERVFGEGHYLRPNFIQPYKCEDVLIDSITIKRSPMWEIHPVLCKNVTVSNVTVVSHGPNNDGCNPESSKNVLIENCFFDTGDDCIAIKSGRNADGRRVAAPSENIIVRNCQMKDGHGGVVIGSEMSGDCRNVFIQDCVMDSPHLERALRIKTNSMRGGVVENIFMRNVEVGEVMDAIIRVNFYYGEGDVGENTPKVRNIYVNNVISEKSNYGLRLEGYERSLISNLNLTNCRFDGVKSGNLLKYYEKLELKDVFMNGERQDHLSMQ